MDVDRSVEGFMDGAATNVRSGHITVKMEMYGVATEAEGLSGIGDLYVADAGNSLVGVRSRSVNHNGGTKLVTSYLITKTTLETRLSRELTWK